MAGWFTLSCSVPCACGHPLAELRNSIPLQMLYLPPSQNSHFSHGKPTSSATRSPAANPRTSEPTASTTPADSWPRVRGSRTSMSPLRLWE